VATQVFRTRRGRITLTDVMLTYEQWGSVQRRVSILRARITEVRLITRVYWFTPPWTEIIVRHSSGTLSIPGMGRRTAEQLRAALKSP
jgi:hypothetical protein